MSESLDERNGEPLKPSSRGPRRGAPGLILVDQFVVPGFTAFVDGEDRDNEASHGIKPGRAGQLIETHPEKG